MEVNLITANIFLFIVALIRSAEGITCGLGQFVHTATNSCQSCPAGHFEDEEEHSNTDCKICLTPESWNNEYEARKCNATADTLILCEEGYFRVPYEYGDAYRGECERCRECGIGTEAGLYVEVTPCGNYTDTVCGTPPPTTTAAATTAAAKTTTTTTTVPAAESTTKSNGIVMVASIPSKYFFVAFGLFIVIVL